MADFSPIVLADLKIFLTKENIEKLKLRYIEKESTPKGGDEGDFDIWDFPNNIDKKKVFCLSHILTLIKVG